MDHVEAKAYKRTRYCLGLFVLACVVVLWVGSSTLIQDIFTTAARPFFLTYFSTSLFSVYFVSHMIIKEWRKRKLANSDGDVATIEGHSSEIWRVGKLSLVLSPVWFAMNYLFNWSLLPDHTTVASNTILSNTSGIWVIVISFLVFRETVHAMNVCGAFFTLAGAAVIGLMDDQAGQNTFFGDLACLCAACLYAVYSVLLSKLVDESTTSMQLLFGMIGLTNMLCLWPVLFLLNATALEPMEAIPLDVLGLLFLNGFFGTVLSDFLWAKAVMLTSPLICSIGLSMTVPLALLVDLVMGVHHDWAYFVGSLLVLVGFVLVNLDFSQSLKEDKHTYEAIIQAEDSDVDTPIDA